MTRYLSLGEVVRLHAMVIDESGGSLGLRDRGALESAVAQPRMTFGGADLYGTIEKKTSALGFSLISNHPFVDGNKRIGHAAMEAFLLLNGFELAASVDSAESIILGVASGNVSREELTGWLASHIVPSEGES